jgi:transcriptional regulator of met regulon
MLSIPFDPAESSMGHDLVKRIPIAITVSARKSNLQILSDDFLDNTMSIDNLNHITNHNLLHLILSFSCEP